MKHIKQTLFLLAIMAIAACKKDDIGVLPDQQNLSNSGKLTLDSIRVSEEFLMLNEMVNKTNFFIEELSIRNSSQGSRPRQPKSDYSVNELEAVIRDGKRFTTGYTSILEKKYPELVTDIVLRNEVIRLINADVKETRKLGRVPDMQMITVKEKTPPNAGDVCSGLGMYFHYSVVYNACVYEDFGGGGLSGGGASPSNSSPGGGGGNSGSGPSWNDGFYGKDSYEPDRGEDYYDAEFAEWEAGEDEFAYALAAFAQEGIEGPKSLIPEFYYKGYGQVPVEMPVATAGQNQTALGYKRDPRYFWIQKLSNEPHMFSEDNKIRVRNARLAPIINEQWVQYNPTHRPYMYGKLVHHHDGQGKFAYAIPETVHKRFDAALHTIRTGKGYGGIKGTLGKMLNVAGLLLFVLDFNGNDPTSTINWFTSGQNQIDKIYYSPSDEVYYQLSSINESSGVTTVVYEVFEGMLEMPEEGNKQYGVLSLGTYQSSWYTSNQQIISHHKLLGL